MATPRSAASPCSSDLAGAARAAARSGCGRRCQPGSPDPQQSRQQHHRGRLSGPRRRRYGRCRGMPSGPGYFRALGTPLVRGREVTERDLASPDKVVVVNEAFVRRFFGDRNPLGRRMMFGASDNALAGSRNRRCRARFQARAVRARRPSRRSTPPIPMKTALTAWNFMCAAERDPGRIGRRKSGAWCSRWMPDCRCSRCSRSRSRLRESVEIDRLIAILSCAFGFLATLLAGDRTIWRGGLHGGAPHGRDRHSGGAGRGAARCAVAGDEGCRHVGDLRSGHRAARWRWRSAAWWSPSFSA